MSGTPALITYLTTPEGPARDAAWLRLLAEQLRAGTVAAWEIPNTLANTVEGIAARLESRP